MDIGRERGVLSHFPAGRIVSVQVERSSLSHSNKGSKADFIEYSLDIMFPLFSYNVQMEMAILFMWHI